MCGSKPTDALRTLPERAFRLRARLIAVGLCAVCFAGSSGGCSGCNYAPALVHPAGAGAAAARHRCARRPGQDIQCRRRAACRQQQLLDLRASPREMPEEKLALAAKGLAEILELDEAKLLEKFNDRRSNDCLLRYRVERETADAVRDFCAANGITGVRINQDSKRWYRRGSFWLRCLGSPTWTMPGSAGWSSNTTTPLPGRTEWC